MLLRTYCPCPLERSQSSACMIVWLYRACVRSSTHSGLHRVPDPYDIWQACFVSIAPDCRCWEEEVWMEPSTEQRGHRYASPIRAWLRIDRIVNTPMNGFCHDLCRDLSTLPLTHGQVVPSLSYFSTGRVYDELVLSLCIDGCPISVWLTRGVCFSTQNLPHPMFRRPCFCDDAARGSMLERQGSSKGRSVSAHDHFLASALCGFGIMYDLCHV